MTTTNFFRVVNLLILAATLMISSLVQVGSLEFNFPTFDKDNGTNALYEFNSYIVLNAIQVTPDVRGGPITNMSGRSVYKTPFRLWSKQKRSIASFNSTFVINISNQTTPGGEGLAFILTGDKELPLSSYGQWLGIVNQSTDASPKTQIVAVEFDTRKSNPDDLDDNHVGLDVNSIRSVVQKSLTSRAIEISAGKSLTALIQYDGKNMSVYVAENVVADPAKDATNLVFSEPINLAAYLPEKVYVGFSASTSNYTELNCVLSWKFEGLEIGEDLNLLWLWIVIPVLAVVVLLGILAGLCLRRRSERRKKKEAYPDIEIEIKYLNPRKFKLGELRKATGNFSPKNKLGQGGFGMVFKGVWINKEIAVKRISEKSHQGKQEFIAEIATIGNLNHRNLVKLLGWCYENKDLLLVYEYLPNGSLDKYLFLNDKLGVEGTVLTWEKRLNVILGLAQALEYLHNGCDRRILHRDIKASNVMLDSEFNAKLGDFGLARTIQQSDITHHSTKEIAGTPGYMAPETFLNGRATTETDVYAFGVLMLEVVSGMKPSYFIDQQNSYKNSIVHWMWELYRKGILLEAADPRLDGGFDQEEMKHVLITGLACCHPNPHQRPSMKKVLKVLMGEEDPPEVPAERPAFMWPAMPPSFSDLDYTMTGNELTVLSELSGR